MSRPVKFNSGRTFLSRMFFVGCFFFCGSRLLQGQTNEQFFQLGNQAYQQENYEAAIDNYEKIIGNGFESWEIYYNLGNAYFRQGNIGRAILNFERAKHLAPMNKDIVHNLDVANLAIIDKIEAPPRFFLNDVFDDLIEFLGLKLNINDLSKVVLSIYLIFMSLIIFRMLLNSPNIRRILLYLSIPMLVLLILALIALEFNLYTHQRLEEAIILVREVEVIGSPEEKAKPLFTLHQGVKVKLTKSITINGIKWREIQLIDGKSGWVQEEVLERI
ncbi:tetratricopeptide repeat protein [candidate division KSB1 bacterium]|nr:tetratricopeptide repeat protein [candidate division KSB1 bacterium]